MYEAIIHFDGPLSRWHRKPHKDEIIAKRTFRFWFIAEAWCVAKTRGMPKLHWLITPL